VREAVGAAGAVRRQCVRGRRKGCRRRRAVRREAAARNAGGAGSATAIVQNSSRQVLRGKNQWWRREVERAGNANAGAEKEVRQAWQRHQRKAYAGVRQRRRCSVAVQTARCCGRQAGPGGAGTWRRDPARRVTLCAGIRQER